MGNWTIVIHGTGCHDNPHLPEDADRMAQKFVKDLVKAGHDVVDARFTSGGRSRLLEPSHPYGDDPIRPTHPDDKGADDPPSLRKRVGGQ